MNMANTTGMPRRYLRRRRREREKLIGAGARGNGAGGAQ